MALESLLTLTEHYVKRPQLGAPADGLVTLYSPDDDIHGALVTLVRSVTTSLVLAMYGYADDELNDAILRALKDDKIYVSLSLDSTQAAGKHESQLLDLGLRESNSVAFGQSEKHAIMHLKMFVIDGLDVGTGSVNWSAGGETKQDNQLTVIRHAGEAARARQKIDLVHESMLTQAAAKAKREQHA
jgi:phosphatidylserine/phosphatidylglycerophosphate/cardiolipin synthase-like enzyme